MKYEVRFTTQFKKDLKLAKKQGKDMVYCKYIQSSCFDGKGVK